MKISKLNQDAVKHANKQASILVLTDEELNLVAGGAAAGIFCRCRYKKYTATAVASTATVSG